MPLFIVFDKKKVIL